MARKLRTAVSVFFGVLAVALCVLWVRSYWWHDEMQVGRKFVLASWVSNRGQLGFAKHLPYLDWNGSLFFVIRPIEERQNGGGIRGFYWLPEGGNFWTGVPHWFAVMCMAGVAVVPWVYRSVQFSLRTLLVATSLMALTLGFLVWVWR